MLSDIWMGLMFLLTVLHDVLGILEAFMSACDCHPSRVCKRLGIEKAQRACPLRTRRIPATVCGDLHDKFNRVTVLKQADILEKGAHLTEADKTEYMTNYNIGIHVIFGELVIRFSVYMRLPLKVCCVGHRALTKARTHLAIALVEYDNLPPGTVPHPRVEGLFSPGSDGRNQVMFFFAWCSSPYIAEHYGIAL